MGAILSTVLAVIQIMRFYYEGVHIKVEVRGGYVVHPPTPPYGDKEHVIITVSNNGRRPATITHVWMRTPSKTSLLSSDCIIRGAQKLEEGDYAQYLMAEEQVQQYGIKQRDYMAIASDATGRHFYSHNLPTRWFKIARMKLFARKGKK